MSSAFYNYSFHLSQFDLSQTRKEDFGDLSQEPLPRAGQRPLGFGAQGSFSSLLQSYKTLSSSRVSGRLGASLRRPVSSCTGRGGWVTTDLIRSLSAFCPNPGLYIHIPKSKIKTTIHSDNFEDVQILKLCEEVLPLRSVFKITRTSAVLPNSTTATSRRPGGQRSQTPR